MPSLYNISSDKPLQDAKRMARASSPNPIFQGLEAGTQRSTFVTPSSSRTIRPLARFLVSHDPSSRTIPRHARFLVSHDSLVSHNPSSRTIPRLARFLVSHDPSSRTIPRLARFLSSRTIPLLSHDSSPLARFLSSRTIPRLARFLVNKHRCYSPLELSTRKTKEMLNHAIARL
ncbi:hypothetical protein K432DRAFT_410389 [Lepidopterella palustris CBS 459.81]|uniref:Uncharacterized protein n=1 Tax=Lepidopterella palustris CBS 459.81 TaxID=1314670 RepID=A0A8E2DYB6_9PEZI|nr:hypothetical protein K432DRAFT_410389 [Lepidopterella palustris CBS 459.81]